MQSSYVRRQNGVFASLFFNSETLRLQRLLLVCCVRAVRVSIESMFKDELFLRGGIINPELYLGGSQALDHRAVLAAHGQSAFYRLGFVLEATHKYLVQTT